MKCRHCKEKFIPKFFNVKYCDKDECYEAMIAQVRIIQKKAKVNEEKKATKLLKEKLKTKSDYEKDLEREINAIIRLIDFGCRCISCNAMGNSAGHFHSVKANGTLRYNLDNMHLQEYSCNGQKGGNNISYGRGLIERYGKEYKEYVEYDLVRIYPLIKWTIEDLKQWKVKAREIIKELKKQNCIYDAESRLKLRAYYNEILGIYK